MAPLSALIPYFSIQVWLRVKAEAVSVGVGGKAIDPHYAHVSGGHYNTCMYSLISRRNDFDNVTSYIGRNRAVGRNTRITQKRRLWINTKRQEPCGMLIGEVSRCTQSIGRTYYSRRQNIMPSIPGLEWNCGVN